MNKKVSSLEISEFNRLDMSVFYSCSPNFQQTNSNLKWYGTCSPITEKKSL